MESNLISPNASWAEQRCAKARRGSTDASAWRKIGSWDHDLTTNRLYWSEEMYRIFEIAPDKLSYKYLLETIHPEDRDAFEAAFREGLAKRAIFITIQASAA